VSSTPNGFFVLLSLVSPHFCSLYVEDEKALRLKNRKCLSYVGGDGSSDLVVFKSVKKKDVAREDTARRYYHHHKYQSAGPTSNDAEEKDFNHTAVFPAGMFFDLFKDPAGDADHLESRCRHLLTRWEKKNADVKNPKGRNEVELRWPYLKQEFTIGNSTYNSVYELQASTFGYTMASRRVQTPEPILLRDIVVSLSVCLAEHSSLSRC